MSAGCVIAPDAGAVRAMLASVACETHDFAHRGFDALTGGQAFQSAVTAALTIYVALVGYRLLFASDGARLSDAPKMALMIGAVLALISSWSLFETLVFDVSARAPSEIAQLLSVGHEDQRRSADPVGRLQVAYDQLLASAMALRNPPPAPTTPAGAGPPQSALVTSDDPSKAELAARQRAAAQLLDVAAGAILMLNAGLIAVSGLVIGLLNAIGPIFLILLLFQQTRGLFEGWVRALVAAALMAMAGWVVILAMLGVVEPWLIALAQQRAVKDVQPNTGVTAAALVFIFSAAQLATAAAAAVIAFGFRLPSPSAGALRAPAARGSGAEAGAVRPTTAQPMSRPDLLADQLRRFDAIFQTREQSAFSDARPVRLAAARTPSDPVPNPGWDRGRSELRRDRYRRAQAGR
jgi:type IV secretion system protein VirB6